MPRNTLAVRLELMGPRRFCPKQLTLKCDLYEKGFRGVRTAHISIWYTQSPFTLITDQTLYKYRYKFSRPIKTGINLTVKYIHIILLTPLASHGIPHNCVNFTITDSHVAVEMEITIYMMRRVSK